MVFFTFLYISKIGVLNANRMELSLGVRLPFPVNPYPLLLSTEGWVLFALSSSDLLFHVLSLEAIYPQVLRHMFLVQRVLLDSVLTHSVSTRLLHMEFTWPYWLCKSQYIWTILLLLFLIGFTSCILTPWTIILYKPLLSSLLCSWFKHPAS